MNTGPFEFLPCKGRWQPIGLTEGYRAVEGGSPLRLASASHLPLQGRISILDTALTA